MVLGAGGDDCAVFAEEFFGCGDDVLVCPVIDGEEGWAEGAEADAVGSCIPHVVFEFGEFGGLEGELDFVEADGLDLVECVAEGFDVVFEEEGDEVHEDEVGYLFDVGFGDGAVGLEDVGFCCAVVAVAECGDGEEYAPVVGEVVASDEAGGFCGGDGAWHEAAFFFFAVAAVGDESAVVEGVDADAGGSAPSGDFGEFDALGVAVVEFGDEFCCGECHLGAGAEAGVGGVEPVDGEVVAGAGGVVGCGFFGGGEEFGLACGAFFFAAACGFGEFDGGLGVAGDCFEDEAGVGEGEADAAVDAAV